MAGGYTGKILWVDLGKGTITEELLGEEVYRKYLGGYGLAARLLYDRIPAKCDPLGPENILGFTVGMMTGSTAPTGTRFTVVGKSPLTDGWGDANGSGYFGPAVKRAGYDGIFFSGISEKPVYLYLDNGRAELKDASHLWGKDCYYIEDWVKENLGKDFESACIGPAGEKLSLISGVIHSKGRAAARSGLGAVMGSKRLKMIAVQGSLPFPMADEAAVKAVRKEYAKQISEGHGAAEFYKVTGTPGYTPVGAVNGDSPTKNWGASTDHYSDAKNLAFDVLLKYRVKKEACWRCPIACWGTSKVEYEGEVIEAHQPEYETASGFGSMTMVDDYPALIRANELCNRYGLDTISAGGCVAFAIECFEEGLIGLEETGGIELRWGDHKAMNAMLKKIALREDFGDVLADGVRKASEKLGSESELFAIHVGGQELPMHDPRFEPGLGLIYQIDATPGRHTQGGQYNPAPGYPTEMPAYGANPKDQSVRGKYLKDAASMIHVMNASGLCLMGYFSTNYTFLPDYLSVLTGWDFDVAEMLKVGERISNIRQAFNVREGINPVAFKLPQRAYGKPPLPDGPTEGVEVDAAGMLKDYLKEMGWTQDAAIPEKKTLVSLGLEDIARDLWESQD
ncbi:MAG: aldehyde ferredoxin oxidoreductase family protein [Anaerolineaceae bacterium]|nr:aldehyde ferredoxin oxidoreductase family protein [Anaerolineaceae bacterium]